MTELSISPLARRIAEENNVDWRALEGSDAGGGVNERDVLNYLEGVMLGTQPVNPTPEPLPEGMNAWAEEVATPQNATSTQSAATMIATDNTGTVEETAAEGAAEDAYRELFAELGALKKAAAETEAAHRKERETADGARAEAQLELAQTQKTLADREGELTELRSQLSQLGADARTREQSASEELARLRETVDTQDEELVQIHALKQQLETLKTQLGGAAAQAKEVQTLSERLAKADAATQKAQAEVETLKTANAGLERTLSDLRAVRLQVPEPEKRPWWKIWG